MKAQKFSIRYTGDLDETEVEVTAISQARAEWECKTSVQLWDTRLRPALVSVFFQLLAEGRLPAELNTERRWMRALVEFNGRKSQRVQVGEREPQEVNLLTLVDAEKFFNRGLFEIITQAGMNFDGFISFYVNNERPPKDLNELHQSFIDGSFEEVVWLNDDASEEEPDPKEAALERGDEEEELKD